MSAMPAPYLEDCEQDLADRTGWPDGAREVKTAAVGPTRRLGAGSG